MRDFLRRRLVAVVIAVIVLLFLSATRIATFLTDLWWFDSLGYRAVFTGILWTQILVGGVFGIVLALLVAVNLMIARRIRPLFVPTTPQQAAVERYRQMADPYLPWIIAAVAVLFGLTAGFAVAGQWDTFLLWRNGGQFGIADPQFNVDVGFYVFDLPWWQFVQTWLFTSLLLVTLLTAGAHYLLGGIRPESSGDKVMPNVKAHLSILLVLLLAIRGWGYWLDRFSLNFSPRGTVTGASFTDVNAELPALNLLLIVTAVAIVLVLISIRRRGFLLPGAAIALLVLASIVLQGAYPAAIQRLRVDPQEGSREAPYIERNLEATRAAYGIGDTPLQRFEVLNNLDEQQVEAEQVTLSNIRLWDPDILQTTYQQLQSLRTYYTFRDVDVDRYIIDDEIRQVMLAARELDQTGLQERAQTWQNLAITYTHGLGVVASQVNTATSEGQPVFVTNDIPPQGADSITPELPDAGIYYGESSSPNYSIVRATDDAPELDYETGAGQQQTTRYAGEGGVVLGNRLKRLAFALRFGDTNFVLSGLIENESRVLFNRDIQDRVRAVAPYLRLDADPYPVVIDNRVLWVQDAYTMSEYYPYSERVQFGDGQRFNYIRNSVKAVVDAYNGGVTLYVIDDEDPIVQAWQRAFPDPYQPIEDAPDGLEDHFRYPQDLFEAQAEIYRTYHMEGVQEFYQKSDAWDIPVDAAADANAGGQQTSQRLMEPYYVLMRLPNQPTEEFVLIQPYLARDRENMTAWLAGRSDPAQYGELFAVQFPSDQTILGPRQVQARIDQEDEIAEYITLRDQAGSRVQRGNLLVVPIGRSILYVEGLFLQSPQAEIPELAQVVLVMGERVVMEPTLDRAIAELVGAEIPDGGDQTPPDQGDGGDGLTGDETADRLLELALEAFARAQEALDQGRLGDYQRFIEQARNLVQQAAEVRGVQPEEPTDTGSDAGTATDTQTDTTEDAGT